MILYRIVVGTVGAAMDMYGLGIVVAPAIGPILGGYLVEYVDGADLPDQRARRHHRHIAAALFLPHFGPSPVGRFDGSAPSRSPPARQPAAGVTEGETWGWRSYPIIILFAVSLVFLGLFVIIELEVDHPLLYVRCSSIGRTATRCC